MHEVIITELGKDNWEYKIFKDGKIIAEESGFKRFIDVLLIIPEV